MISPWGSYVRYHPRWWLQSLCPESASHRRRKTADHEPVSNEGSRAYTVLSKYAGWSKSWNTYDLVYLNCCNQSYTRRGEAYWLLALSNVNRTRPTIGRSHGALPNRGSEDIRPPQRATTAFGNKHTAWYRLRNITPCAVHHYAKQSMLGGTQTLNSLPEGHPYERHRL